ncbi:MAG: UDP-N-acetylmuramoyl-L-alanine--D-glutamate ligase [Candidatus Stahlbacteria bacterium]|nr:MAG: UDP-N-acetylmuramoyl-L-alanine--D-glutamate ligase [Candidatus Stahlbacteria bacterium]
MGNPLCPGRAGNPEGEVMRRIGILGLGRVGRSLLSYLMDKDVEILLYDENPQALAHRRVRFAIDNRKARAIDNPADLKQADLLLKSPGIPNEADWIRKLDEAGVRMIDEIEYVWKELGEPMTVAVTGTNGKSTTTAWIAKVLKAAGKKAFCGGNISPGRPFSEALGHRRYEAYVIEVSTFQLERCPSFRPNIGVLLNITADHLNRHSLEGYVNLKLSLFKNHRAQDRAVLNADDENIKKRLEQVKGQHILFSLQRTDVDAYLKEGGLFLWDRKIIDRGNLPLAGLHNAANALAAIAVAGEFNLPQEAIGSGLRKFKGLPHRMQYLGKLKGREVYNNSMCTNPVAFYHSVRAFDEPSVIIAGGTEKGLTLEPFIQGVKEQARFVVLFGENAERLKKILEKDSRFSSCVTVTSLRAALQAALTHSSEGDRILFSPGFASFGNFRNFEERGNAFIQAYRELIRET